MASPIDDARSLPGETISDQDGLTIGKVKQVYALGGEESVMWVTVETSTGIGHSRLAFVPLARLKREDDEIRVPYSIQHIQSSPQIEPGDEISEHEDRKLRHFYAIDLADQELRTDNDSYADQVPEEEGAPRKVEG